jgi:hypothetical protein
VGDVMKKIIFSENCPADTFRKYVEDLIRKQIECGENIPEEYMIPKKVVLSNECLKFFIQDPINDFVGASIDGDEVSIYWEKSETLPALEVRTVLNPDTKEYELDYIKENASDDKAEFIWDRNNPKCKKGSILIYKSTDNPDEIFDVEPVKK